MNRSPLLLIPFIPYFSNTLAYSVALPIYSRTHVGAQVFRNIGTDVGRVAKRVALTEQ